MKMFCLKVDITDISFIKKCILKCIRNKKKKRRDIRRIQAEYGIEEWNEDSITKLAQDLSEEIKNRKLILKPIYYKDKYDQASGKWRRIGIQDIKQQIFDYIIVEALLEGGALARIGKFQFASIPGKGQVSGAKQIYKWIHESKATLYVLKADVKQYYPSVPRDTLMNFLQKRIMNEDLLWLIETLIYTFESGLSVGSYLSQYLANLYMSILYHDVEDNMFRIRNGKKKVRLVNWQAYYMDDVVFIGANKRNLMCAKERAGTVLENMGVRFKPTWKLYKLTDDSFIDMMGFRIYKNHITIRRGTFKKIRRAYLRYKRKPDSVTLARRVVSFYGSLKHSRSYQFCRRYDVYKLKHRARKEISKHDASTLQQRTTELSDGNVQRSNTCTAMS